MHEHIKQRVLSHRNNACRQEGVNLVDHIYIYPLLSGKKREKARERGGGWGERQNQRGYKNSSLIKNGCCDYTKLDMHVCKKAPALPSKLSSTTTIQTTAAYCDKLQHTATHCNTRHSLREPQVLLFSAVTFVLS